MGHHALYVSAALGAGDIEVQTINEGALHLQSSGGAVKVGSIKASDISVATSGVQQCAPLL